MPYQDGNFPAGAPVLVSAAGHAFKCNNFTSQPSAETVQITDEEGVHSGALQYTGPLTFQAELQYANNNVPELVPACMNNQLGVFNNVAMVGPNGVAANRVCFITDVSTAKPQRGPWTATVTGQARVNP